MKNYRHIHFLGIGGISQSAIALILKDRGYIISGSDRTESDETKRLAKSGIAITINRVSPHIESADLIVASAAIHESDIELKRAKELGKKIISRAEALGILASSYENVISISGSHGKTTTTGMIAKIFVDAGKDPTIHIGGNLAFIDQNVRLGSREFFITEACEYVDSFLQLKSDVSVILNIQKDHLDYFKTFENIDKSFTQFAANTKEGGIVIYNGDDEHTNKRYREISLSYSLKDKGIVSAKNIHEYTSGKYAFDLYFLQAKLGEIQLGTFGLHNVSNALAAAAVALRFGIDMSTISRSLRDFTGAKRRFESYGDLFGTALIHDYAHHPTEIKATIELAKRVAKGDVYVIFQPHTYSRTKLLLEEFKTCFQGSKEVLVYRVYSAREDKSEGIDEVELARVLRGEGEEAKSFEDYKNMLRYIFPKLKPDDMLLVLGAGDIESFLPYIKNLYSTFKSEK